MFAHKTLPTFKIWFDLVNDPLEFRSKVYGFFLIFNPFIFENHYKFNSNFFTFIFLFSAMTLQFQEQKCKKLLGHLVSSC